MEIGYRDGRWMEMHLHRVPASKAARTLMFNELTGLKQHHYIKHASHIQVVTQYRTTHSAGHFGNYIT
jgi:hypothetical protein